jgi:hypothetical protein
LLQNRAIGVSANQRSFRAVFNQRKDFAAFDRAIYSDSVIDIDIDFVFVTAKKLLNFRV